MQAINVHDHAVLPLLPLDHLERILFDAERDSAKLDNVSSPQNHPPVLKVLLGVRSLRSAGLGTTLHLILVGEDSMLNH